LLVPHDDPAAERARREQQKIADVSATNLSSSGNGDKWTQMKALLVNPRYLFLLTITLLVGYGKHCVPFFCGFLYIHSV
jgi:hypothetical protein